MTKPIIKKTEPKDQKSGKRNAGPGEKSINDKTLADELKNVTRMRKFHFLNATEAVRDLREKEKEYLIVDHELEKGEIVPVDAHQSSEWIILHPGKGSCIITRGECREIIELSPKEAIMISIPAGFKHSLEAITDISYTVLRDGFN